MTAPANSPNAAPIKAAPDPGDENISTAPGVNVTENNKFKGSLVVEAFDGMISTINEEAESATEYAVGVTFDTIGAVSAAVEFLADPFAQIFGAGVGWLMEHVGPLKEALDAITGNPDEIMQNSEDTKAQAAAIRVLSEDHKQQMGAFTGWEGSSSDAYRNSMRQLGVELRNLTLNHLANAVGGTLAERVHATVAAVGVPHGTISRWASDQRRELRRREASPHQQ